MRLQLATRPVELLQERGTPPDAFDPWAVLLREALDREGQLVVGAITEGDAPGRTSGASRVPAGVKSVYTGS